MEKKAKMCIECYTNERRKTPLLNPVDCLKNHTQYICGTCGRCICIERDPKRGLQRWNFPFRSLENAKLYLRTADYTMKKPCGIYEIKNSGGKKSYKIFPDLNSLQTYLAKNTDKICENPLPLLKKTEYKEYPKTQVRKLTRSEAESYTKERNQEK